LDSHHTQIDKLRADLAAIQPPDSGLVEETVERAISSTPDCARWEHVVALKVGQALALYREGKQWSPVSPSESGWWWFDGNSILPFGAYEVVKRPGHDYLAIQDPFVPPGGERHFYAVSKLRGRWAKATPPGGGK
jgi:hypothetical protein